jgi:flagellar motor switch protein FliN/FliY
MKIQSVRQVKVPIEAVLGGTEVTVEQIAGLHAGSIVELDEMAGEPVSLVASGRQIARGEVIVIDGHFGIRVTELVNEVP